MSQHTENGVRRHRQKTDESLHVERDRANKTLAHDRDLVESSANETIANERLEVDQARITQRKETDQERNAEQDLQSMSIPARVSRDLNEQCLHAERKEADSAVAQERARIDLTIEKERNTKNQFIIDLLSKERGQTDFNLDQERKTTDSKVLDTSANLVTEIAAHLQTQTELTTRDEFLAIVSHDLKNPMGAILSSADILLEEVTGKMSGNHSEKRFSSEIIQYIQMIKRNAAKGLRLIDDILDMESVAQGKMRLILGAVNIQDLVHEAVDTCAHIAKSKNISIKMFVEGTLPNLMCDRGRMLQVITNIIGNAVKFTPVGGTIKISVSTKDKNIFFTFQDDGPGIPPSKTEAIFSRYAQLGSAHRTGLGLGLYISKMFVEAHHGEIWVESELGKGSQFHLKLPNSSP